MKSDFIRQEEAERKNFVLEYLRLVGSGKFKEGLRFFAPDCKTHNPFIFGSIDVLTDAMVASNNEGFASILKLNFL
jgi:hypothetical protein